MGYLSSQNINNYKYFYNSKLQCSNTQINKFSILSHTQYRTALPVLKFILSLILKTFLTGLFRKYFKKTSVGKKFLKSTSYYISVNLICASYEINVKLGENRSDALVTH